MTVIDLAEMVDFIATFQSDPATQFAHVGLTPAEIAADLTEYEVMFEIERRDETLIGVLGIDTDEEIGRAYVYGPFVDDSSWDEVANDLWQRATSRLPSDLKDAEMAYGEANSNAARFAERHGFDVQDVGAVMTLDRPDRPASMPPGAIPYETRWAKDVSTLHERLFPGRWLTGSQMVGGLNEFKRLFLAVEGQHRLGYAYGEARPEVPDCSIEFIGVDPSARGRGLGTTLTQALVTWLFSFPQLETIGLFVRDNNPGARSIYERLGFAETQRLIGARKKLDTWRFVQPL